jgi:hypothetical protein
MPKGNSATHPDELPEPSAITEPLLLDESCLDVTESDPRHRVGLAVFRIEFDGLER